MRRYLTSSCLIYRQQHRLIVIWKCNHSVSIKHLQTSMHTNKQFKIVLQAIFNLWKLQNADSRIESEVRNSVLTSYFISFSVSCTLFQSTWNIDIVCKYLFHLRSWQCCFVPYIQCSNAAKSLMHKFWPVRSISSCSKPIHSCIWVSELFSVPRALDSYQVHCALVICFEHLQLQPIFFFRPF